MRAKRSRIYQKVFEKTGLPLSEYCTKYLHCNHKAFEHRARLKRLYPNEMIFMCWHLNLSATDLFGEPFLQTMMSHGQPGITKLTEEIENMHSENPELLQLLELPNSSGTDLPEILVPVLERAPEKTVAAQNGHIEDDLFNDFQVTR